MACNDLKDSKNGKQRRRNPLKKGFIRKNNIKVRVGSNYQADIPELLSRTENNTEHQKSISVWVPSDDFAEDDNLIDYLFLSDTKYGLNIERSLGFLFYNDSNMNQAFKGLSDLFPTMNWSNFEKHNFEIAFEKFGKNFEQIKKKIPNKTLKEIICYYYLQKYKENALYSIVVEDSIIKLEHCCKRQQNVNCGKSYLATLNNEDSNDMIVNKYCSFCGVLCTGHQQTLTPICEKCYIYFRKKQESGDRLILCLPCPDKFHSILAHKKCLSPQDMYDYHYLLKSIGQEKINDEDEDEIQSTNTTVRTRSSYTEKNKKKNKFYKYIKSYETIFPINKNCFFSSCNSAGMLQPIPDTTGTEVKLTFLRSN